VRQFALPLVCAVFLLTAGCGGLSQEPGATPADTATTTIPSERTTTTATPAGGVSDAVATDRALAAERDRVHERLTNATGLDGVAVGVYGDPTATLRNRTAAGVYVRVEMTFSYEYACPEGSEYGGGALDAERTEAVYRVTPDETTLVAVREDAYNVCTEER
jgi:hypothetical protein